MSARVLRPSFPAPPKRKSRKRKLCPVLHLHTDPSLAETLYLRAERIDEDCFVWLTADALYRECIRLDPSHDRAMTNLGNICYRRGLYAEAKAWYHRALDIDPTQPEALQNLQTVLEESRY